MNSQESPQTLSSSVEIPEKVKEYFSRHSLNPAFLKNNLGWKWDDNTITIPIYDQQGKEIYSKYRHLDFSKNSESGTPKFTFDKGSHPSLYCVHKIKNLDAVVLAEGEIDVCRLWQEGTPAVTGTSGVKTFNAELAAPLKGKIITICLDSDEAGKSSIAKYCEILVNIAKELFIINLPPEFKDVSDYFTAGHTKKDFDELPRLSFNEWQITNEPEKFAFEEDKDLLAQSLPEEEWLIDRILPVEGFCFIVGAEATGKSFYTLTLADSATTGKKWLDQFEVKKTVKVLFIDKENTRRRTQTRLKGLHMTGKNIWHLRYPQLFQLADPKEESGFSIFALSASRKVKEYGITLIIIDSFTDVMVGNESVAGDVQQFFDAMRQLFPGCSILVLHHASKPAAGVTRNSSQLTRGSTNIMAQVYSAFYVKNIIKSKNEFIIEQTKAGDAEKLKKFKVELVSTPNHDDSAKTIVSSIKYGGEIQEEQDKIESAKEFIEEIFSGEAVVSRKELVGALGSKSVSNATAVRAMREMVEDKILEIIKTGRESNYYWKGGIESKNDLQ